MGEHIVMSVNNTIWANSFQ